MVGPFRILGIDRKRNPALLAADREAIILESDRDGITLYTTKVQLLEILASI